MGEVSRRLCSLLHFLGLGLVSVVVVQVVNGLGQCPDCGSTSVPYPLSTSSTCGHRLYPVTCHQNTLELHTVSFNYTIKQVDVVTGTLLVDTAGFLGNTCITQDSSQTSRNLSLDSSLPFFLMPNNTVFLLNASDTLLFSPLDCKATNPCTKALSVLPQVSCRGLLCCSFSVAGSSTFRYGFPIYGQETAYVSVVNLNENTEATTWTYGLQVGWEIPQEPPCTQQSDCGSSSSCSSSLNRLGTFCLCNEGYDWDPVTGTCPKAPYCKVESHSIRCNKAKYAIGFVIGLVGIFAISALTFYACKRCRTTQKAQDKLVKKRAAILAENSGGKSARLFSSKEMKKATNNFARNTVLGCGGFGEVYKGVLKDGTAVAIKSAKIGNTKGTDQVLNEVRILSQVNHRNLVRLLGCCVESELPLLVYEYVPNGNLYDHIHGLKGSVLDWRTRIRISFQAAEGLAYLHFAAYPPIYHRDVKSSNILLDKSMNARVSDFGLSRLAEPDLTHVSTCAQGTLGYLDPEYYRNYQLTDRSDVYSFGVVLLELVTSMKAIDFRRSQDEVNLTVMVQSRADQGKLDDVFAAELTQGASKWVVDSMRSVLSLALDCLKENRQSRPSMKEVADKLRQGSVILETMERDAENGSKSAGITIT